MCLAMANFAHFSNASSAPKTSVKTELLKVELHLPGGRSLKDKRRRLAKLRDKFGRQTGMAVCESDFADDLQRSEWSFVACAGSAAVVAQMLAEVENYIVQFVDAEIVSMQRQGLN